MLPRVSPERDDGVDAVVPSCSTLNPSPSTSCRPPFREQTLADLCHLGRSLRGGHAAPQLVRRDEASVSTPEGHCRSPGALVIGVEHRRWPAVVGSSPTQPEPHTRLDPRTDPWRRARLACRTVASKAADQAPRETDHAIPTSSALRSGNKFLMLTVVGLTAPAVQLRVAPSHRTLRAAIRHRLEARPSWRHPELG